MVTWLECSDAIGDHLQVESVCRTISGGRTGCVCVLGRFWGGGVVQQQPGRFKVPHRVLAWRFIPTFDPDQVKTGQR